MDDEVLDMVDRNGKVIKQIQRKEAYEKGLLHQAVNIIVVNKQREIYLQQRSESKKSYPLHWDISVSEHLKSGENSQKAATRGLLEELSISAPIKLIRPKHIQKSKFVNDGQIIIENELVELYGCFYDGKIEIDPDEVADGKFVSMNHIFEIKTNLFTSWALDELEYLSENKDQLEKLISQ